MDQLLSIIQNPLVISIAVMIFAKLLPNKRLEQFGYFLGRLITLNGNKWLGKKYEKIEDGIKDGLGVIVTGFNRGIDSDDKKEE